MNTNRRTEAYVKKQEMGQNDRPACLWCNGDILDKMRSTFCQKSCAEEFYLRSRPNHARLRVFERDKGICALCSIDVFAGTERTPRSRGTGDLWQADHINPVIEGGGECGLDNLRTLCTSCHRSVTNALRKRLSAVRKPIEMPAMFTAPNSCSEITVLTDAIARLNPLCSCVDFGAPKFAFPPEARETAEQREDWLNAIALDKR